MPRSPGVLTISLLKFLRPELLVDIMTKGPAEAARDFQSAAAPHSRLPTGSAELQGPQGKYLRPEPLLHCTDPQHESWAGFRPEAGSRPTELSALLCHLSLQAALCVPGII